MSNTKFNYKIRRKDVPFGLLWEIKSISNSKVLIEALGGKVSHSLSWEDVTTSYIKVNKDGSESDLNDTDQLEFYGFYDATEFLPSGGGNTELSCSHDWKVYNGLNFSDEYCTKCNVKREIQNK